MHKYFETTPQEKRNKFNEWNTWFKHHKVTLIENNKATSNVHYQSRKKTRSGQQWTTKNTAWYKKIYNTKKIILKK